MEPAGRDAVYQSPFSWRYGSDEMRRIWSETDKRLRWRQVWVALAEAQAEAGLTTREQVEDLRQNMERVDITRAHEIEAEIRHDLMAEVLSFAEQCPVGGRIIHLGATSMDISDNAEVLRLRDSLRLILHRLDALLDIFASLIETWAQTPCMGWTHLQPAEPTTIGYRLAVYAQDLLADEADLVRIHSNLRGKGIKGAVGTRASYGELLAGTGYSAEWLDNRVMELLELSAFTVTHQTYPRRQDWIVVSALSGLAGTLYRAAFDLRLLQNPAIGEWSEPFGKRQVGSSAMPFKRNPVSAENIDSLGRLVASLPQVAWDNAAHSLLERTLDNSANRRVILPQAFLAVDHMLITLERILNGLNIDQEAVRRNLDHYGAFSATERVLMALGRAGADRQEMHERIRQHSMVAWAAVRAGADNPLVEQLAGDEDISRYLTEAQVTALMDASSYTGDASTRARTLAYQIRKSRSGD